MDIALAVSIGVNLVLFWMWSDERKARIICGISHRRMTKIAKNLYKTAYGEDVE